jgi:hypothetical protein
MDREVKAQRDAAEALARQTAQLQAFNETNFPPLAAGAGVRPLSSFDKSFTAITQAAVEAEERERARQAALERDAERARHEMFGMYMPRFRPNRLGKDEAEDDVPPQKEFVPSRGPDEEGFTEVRAKARKSKRELTTAELNAKFAEVGSDESEDGAADHNGELFERRRREELY